MLFAGPDGWRQAVSLAVWE